MSLLIESSYIVNTIHKYRKFYVKNNLLSDLYCAKNDGTHLPLVVKVDKDDSVYLCCYSCDYVKQAGLVTADDLIRRMKSVDTEVK